MARQETIISVFVASPSDMAEERELLEEIVSELNLTWSSTLKLRVELLKWETHTHPSMGAYPQDVVNRQIADDYDIFVGLMGAKFGSRTESYGSGTEEEFERARARHIADPTSVEIMMYFKSVEIIPKLEDLDEIRKVLEFRNNAGALGAYYFTFDTLESLEKLFRVHLSRKVQAWGERSGASNASPTNSLSPISDAAEDEEMGMLDAVDLVEERFASMATTTAQMTKAIGELGERMKERTAELNALPRGLNGQPDRKLAKRIITATALDFDRFSELSKATLPLYRKFFQESMDALVKATQLSVDFGGAENYELQKSQIAPMISSLHEALTGAKSGAQNFRNTISGLPRIASDFNSSKRGVISALDTIISEFESNLIFLAGVEL